MIYIIISIFGSLFFFGYLILVVLGSVKPGSDHWVHLARIEAIKKNGHKFLTKDPAELNIKYFFDPMLYHWILSYLPKSIYSKHYQFINLFTKFIELLLFNLFLILIRNFIKFADITFLYSNIVFISFPFSYTLWNAKNVGLSARGIGLLLGQVYLYLIVVYVFVPNISIYIALFFVVLLIWLSSLMAMQLVFLSLLVFVFVFRLPELLLLPILSFGFYFFLSPNVAKKHLIGQFNHKRNYALFFAESLIWKQRPSVFRDFFYDFWILFRINKLKALWYIYNNPLSELIYGFIPLIYLLIFSYFKTFSYYQGIIFDIVIVTLILFIITCIKWLRFLGEPQRYVEFAIPLIAFLFVLNTSLDIMLIFVFFELVVISLPKFINNIQNGESQKTFFWKYLSKIFGMNFSISLNKKKSEVEDYKALLEFFGSKNCEGDILCVSNDEQLLKYVSGIEIKVCKPDYTSFYKTKKDFFNYLYNDNFTQISAWAIKKFCEEFHPDFIVINKSIYKPELVITLLNDCVLEIVKNINNFVILKINKI